MADTRWYVVHTYSGYENKVKENIKMTIQNRQLQDQIVEVLVPEEEVVEVQKNGVKKKISRKIFPGYVLLNMVMNDDTWYVVRNTRGVTGFVGPGSKPVPLTEEEMKNLLATQSGAEVNTNFEVGTPITVISGVWKDTQAVIKEINTKKQTVTINVDMFGRETPVEVNFDEVRADN